MIFTGRGFVSHSVTATVEKDGQCSLAGESERFESVEILLDSLRLYVEPTS